MSDLCIRHFRTLFVRRLSCTLLQDLRKTTTGADCLYRFRSESDTGTGSQRLSLLPICPSSHNLDLSVCCFSPYSTITICCEFLVFFYFVTNDLLFGKWTAARSKRRSVLCLLASGGSSVQSSWIRSNVVLKFNTDQLQQIHISYRGQLQQSDWSSD